MIGIYALTWEHTDSLYIGQSQNVHNRYKEHIKALSNNAVTYNDKLQNMYNTFGQPSLLILEECSLLELDEKEISWIKEFDSVNLGLNVAYGGSYITRGTVGPKNKYSKITILKAFSMLYRTLHTMQYISNRTGISINMLSHISTGACHVWLKEAYPNQYDNMLHNIDKRIKNNQMGNKYNETKQYPLLRGPDGNTYHIDNVRAFCSSREDLGLSGISNLYAVMLGKRKSHKGYTLVDQATTTITEVTRPIVIDPDGVLFDNITNITEFCRNHTLLCDNPRVSARGISSLLRGERSSYKGFKLIS